MTTRHASVLTRQDTRRPSVLNDELLVAAARHLAYQLPLGLAPLPLVERRRDGWVGALRRLEEALVSVAVRHDVVIDVDETSEVLARRLARARAIAPAAGDAVAALAPVLRRGAGGETNDILEVGAVRVAERVVGYLRGQ